MLLVQNKRYEFRMDINEYVLSGEDIFYIRLPDPGDGDLDGETFSDDNYPYYMIFEGIVDLAVYDDTTTKTKFLEVDTSNAIPDELEWEDDFGPNDTNVIDFIHDAVEDLGRTVDDRQFFGRNNNGDQLLFANFPTFKSHVAIVLSVKDYS